MRRYKRGRVAIDYVAIANLLCGFSGFRDFPLADLPMLGVLERTSAGVFVPLTVGGGIRGFTAADGRQYSALEVAAQYFR